MPKINLGSAWRPEYHHCRSYTTQVAFDRTNQQKTIPPPPNAAVFMGESARHQPNRNIRDPDAPWLANPPGWQYLKKGCQFSPDPASDRIRCYRPFIFPKGGRVYTRVGSPCAACHRPPVQVQYDLAAAKPVNHRGAEHTEKIEKRMFPTLIRIGALRLPTYATLLSVGLVGGVLLSAWQGRRYGVGRTAAIDAALLGASGGLVGARAAYVAVNWSFYRDHLGEAARLWAGGLAWQGGLVLGLALVALYGLRYRIPLGRLLDALALGLAWFILFIWLGTGAANDVYGRESFPGEGLLWRLSADLPDLYGLRAPRVNVALLGAAWSGLVLVALWALRGRLRRPGALFLTCLALTGLGGLVLVPLQANAVPYLFHVRIDWLFNLVLVLGGVGGLVGGALWGTKDPCGRRRAKDE
jgi:phosphatidylglycerol:prolipoprotein diacylglycerol transferase